ncbi:MAG TPA: dienelactone hydrolase family protein [Candidatus Polarisedimenticolia bacterium]|nr:dienelactone hydrolase family protein [Candidatus Polarisedimenticolia bacterium]
MSVRSKSVIPMVCLFLTAALAGAQQTAPASAPPGAGLPPPAEAGARPALESSPRHGEYADVKVPGTDQSVRVWVVYPERKDKAPVAIVIHEIFGLTDWIRSVADRLAADGFIAVAPDLLSGKGPGGGGTPAFADRDAVIAAIRGLSPDEVFARLNAVRDWGIQLPAAAGKSVTVGFCWGGSTSFAYAAAQPALDAAVVYYGSAPETARLASISAPVLGLYGSDDARVNATIEPAAAEMKRLGKIYEHEIYEGAGHGFLRAQDGRDGANLAAAGKAWPRMLSFLKEHAR